jgi:hypothetical protein
LWINADIQMNPLIKFLSAFSACALMCGSANAVGPNDSLKSDSTSAQAEQMYRSSMPVMRRDAPAAANKASDTAQRLPSKLPELMTTPPPMPKQQESFLALPGERKAPSGPQTHLKKSGVLIAVGACAIVGGAVAFYLVKNSQDKSAVAINNRIPPPPDPPPGGIFILP